MLRNGDDCHEQAFTGPQTVACIWKEALYWLPMPSVTEPLCQSRAIRRPSPPLTLNETGMSETLVENNLAKNRNETE